MIAFLHAKKSDAPRRTGWTLTFVSSMARLVHSVFRGSGSTHLQHRLDIYGRNPRRVP